MKIWNLILPSRKEYFYESEPRKDPNRPEGLSQSCNELQNQHAGLFLTCRQTHFEAPARPIPKTVGFISSCVGPFLEIIGIGFRSLIDCIIIQSNVSKRWMDDTEGHVDPPYLHMTSDIISVKRFYENAFYFRAY